MSTLRGAAQKKMQVRLREFFTAKPIGKQPRADGVRDLKNFADVICGMFFIASWYWNFPTSACYIVTYHNKRLM